VARGRVACRDVGDIDEIVLDGVERAGRGGGCFGSICSLTRRWWPLYLLAPDCEHALGERCVGDTQLDMVRVV